VAVQKLDLRKLFVYTRSVSQERIRRNIVTTVTTVTSEAQP
jgi:hypothetical protein